MTDKPQPTIEVFWSEEDKGYIARDLKRPGCCAFGKTRWEAASELMDAREAWDKAMAAANA